MEKIDSKMSMGLTVCVYYHHQDLHLLSPFKNEYAMTLKITQKRQIEGSKLIPATTHGKGDIPFYQGKIMVPNS